MPHTRLTVLSTMKQTGLIPLFYHDDVSVCEKVIKACHAGGARVFEFTNRGRNALDTFKSLNKYVQLEMPDMILGIGSIVDASTAALFIQAGTSFIVSPVLNLEMVRVCNRRKVAVIPGCGSVSEISTAEELGVEIVKIFPATQVGGPAFVKSILAPMPWVSVMPTGGVTPDEANLRSWFDAGVACVGMGSNLVTMETDGTYSEETITRNVKEVISTIGSFRHKL